MPLKQFVLTIAALLILLGIVGRMDAEDDARACLDKIFQMYESELVFM